MKKQMITLAFLGMASVAGANSFTAGGTVFEPSHGYTYRGERWLINDGSFEDGSCVNGPWICNSDNDCDWIADLVPYGLWNYDGNHVAWLGGFCGGVPTQFTSICQLTEIGYCPPGFTWYWMAYINEGGSRVFLTIDGNVEWERVLTPGDHMLGYQMDYVQLWDLYDQGQPHQVCWHYDRNGAYGDSYFLDYIDAFCGATAAMETSFSTVKSLY